MGVEVDARRLALRYCPPAIVVEYSRKQSYRTQLYHHEIDLQGLLPPPQTAAVSDCKVSDIVEQITEVHGSVLENVSTEQLKRLVRKLAGGEPTVMDDSESRNPAPTLAVLPAADYNRVSESQLRQVKDKMNIVFEKNIVRPGDSGFQYDKQVAFTHAEEASEWDD